jgi:hypothetical protein
MAPSPRFRPGPLLATPLLLVSMVSGCEGTTKAPTKAVDCLSGPAAANTGSFDISVVSILVTQAIQTTNPLNSVPFVADRGTAVRVMLATGGPNPVSGVTGTLTVTVNGNPVTLSTHALPLNGSMMAPVAPSWANECDTLNFEIPAPTGITVSTIAPSTDVKFHVDIAPLAGETSISNNVSEVTLPVTARYTPYLYYTPIDFAGTGNPDPNFIKPGVGDSFVRGIFPVNDADPQLYQQATSPSIAWPDPNGDGVLDAFGSEGDDLLIQLEQSRELMVIGGVGPNSRLFLFGWVAGNPIDGNGLSTIGGRVGFGNTDPQRGQRTFAHELGHNFGFDHNMDPIVDIGWDVGGRLADGSVNNNVAPDGRIKPALMFDIMYPDLLTNQAWIDTYNYGELYKNPILASETGYASNGYLVIQGKFNPAGTQLAKRLAVFRYPWPLFPPTPRPGPGPARYTAVVTNTAGKVAKAPFDALVDTPKMKLRHGAFEVSVKIGGEVAELKIIDNQSGAVLIDRKMVGKPSLTLTSPTGGSKLGARTDITWDSSFGVPADEVEYQIAYSPDNGKTFVPLAVGITGADTKKVTVNTREIAKSQGAGLIRVFLSDGLNTAYADVTNLSTTAAIY